MENLELYLSIFASVLGIIGAVIGFKNSKDIKKMEVKNSHNKLGGKNNIQRNGDTTINR